MGPRPNYFFGSKVQLFFVGPAFFKNEFTFKPSLSLSLSLSLSFLRLASSSIVSFICHSPSRFCTDAARPSLSFAAKTDSEKVKAQSSAVNGDTMEKQKGLQISALDDNDEEQNEHQQEEYATDEFDDDEEEEEEEEKEFVTLGFVEKPKTRWSLLRQLFPSKAGGIPAWLDPMNLPSGKSCVCDICGEPLQFLLQVYAPIEKEYAFHRTLFVFMCLSMSCLRRDQHEQWKRHPEKPSRSVKVFRCQLPRFNPFYPSEPPRHDGTDKPSGAGAALCSWCGTWKGDKLCSSCRTARYCSEKHQVMHWRAGHKIDCQRMIISSECPNKNGATSANLQKAVSNTLWAEYEMIIENETEFSTEMVENNACTNSLISKEKIDDTMMSHVNIEGDDDKKSWASFQECIAMAPEQVLRYCRDGSAKPLWPMSSGRPSKADIPKCKYCGGPLCFEFQILPQLLYYFSVKDDVDSLDWGTIVAYACEASCEGNVAYKEEYAWVQHATLT